VTQEGRNTKRKVNLFAIFLKTIRNAEKYVQMTK
ncbi:DNA-binding protein, partial [Escherichia coli]